MFCCLRLLNGVWFGQFIVRELFTLLAYFAVFVLFRQSPCSSLKFGLMKRSRLRV